MNKPLSVLIVSAVVLTSCASARESRLNPFNWFGQSRSERVVADENVNPLIPARRASIFRQTQDSSYQGTLVGQVTRLTLERRPGGAVLNVTGVGDRQGFFEVRLIKNDEQSNETTLSYDLRALQIAAPTGSVASRTVSAGLWLTDQELSGIRTVRVAGANNAQVTRR